MPAPVPLRPGPSDGKLRFSLCQLFPAVIDLLLSFFHLLIGRRLCLCQLCPLFFQHALQLRDITICLIQLFLEGIQLSLQRSDRRHERIIGLLGTFLCLLAQTDLSLDRRFLCFIRRFQLLLQLSNLLIVLLDQLFVFILLALQ